MKEVDAWLTDLLERLEPGVEIADAKQKIKDKILESYRNGQRDCPKCNPKLQRRKTQKEPTT